MGNFNQQTSINYALNEPNNGVYLMLIEGEISVGEQGLQTKDAIGISQTENIDIQIIEPSKILIIEVPMN
jgi:redox-sensitive bicupin YhaK (pirin superfamily)